MKCLDFYSKFEVWNRNCIFYWLTRGNLTQVKRNLLISQKTIRHKEGSFSINNMSCHFYMYFRWSFSTNLWHAQDNMVWLVWDQTWKSSGSSLKIFNNLKIQSLYKMLQILVVDPFYMFSGKLCVKSFRMCKGWAQNLQIKWKVSLLLGQNLKIDS